MHEKVLAFIKVLKLLLVQSQTIYNRLTRRLKRLATWTDRTDTRHTWPGDRAPSQFLRCFYICPFPSALLYVYRSKQRIIVSIIWPITGIALFVTTLSIQVLTLRWPFLMEKVFCLLAACFLSISIVNLAYVSKWGRKWFIEKAGTLQHTGTRVMSAAAAAGCNKTKTSRSEKYFRQIV